LPPAQHRYAAVWEGNWLLLSIFIQPIEDSRDARFDAEPFGPEICTSLRNEIGYRLGMRPAVDGERPLQGAAKPRRFGRKEAAMGDCYVPRARKFSEPRKQYI